jgi:hypothetical protein
MVSAQLSLFDTAAVIKPTYEVGDRVKLRKKPISATYLKKGDVVEIAVVHPIDGSIKFWNQRSERWEFIHPDEIGSIFKSESATDSPTPAEVAVGESNCPHSETDTIPSVDAAIESNCLPNNIDSPTPAEVAVGASKALSGETDCFVLDPISVYRPRGTARGGEYYRFSYKEGGKVRQVHIRGGNIASP